MTTDSIAQPKFTEKRDANGALIPAPPDLGALARQIGAKLAAASPSRREIQPARIGPRGATSGEVDRLTISMKRELARQVPPAR